jgi:GntR family transcriptional regulator, transcriptional repressor for pyruvate dehydrogenase complex
MLPQKSDPGQALTRTLVKQLLDLIKTGELPLGSKLPPERELAQQLNVSRSSLRQAFKSLETMGVISSRVGVGNFVRSDMAASNLLVEPMEFAIRMNNISRAKLYEMRQILEVQLVGLTAARASEESIASIAAEVESMKANCTNPRAMADSDYRFHLAIIRSCGNEIFELIYEPISKLLWEDLRERMHLFDPNKIIELHQFIYDAIRERNANIAMDAMKRHLEVGYQTFFGAQSEEWNLGQKRSIVRRRSAKTIRKS